MINLCFEKKVNVSYSKLTMEKYESRQNLRKKFVDKLFLNRTTQQDIYNIYYRDFEMFNYDFNI